jgi:hypothetical protein
MDGGRTWRRAGDVTLKQSRREGLRNMAMQAAAVLVAALLLTLLAGGKQAPAWLR